MVVDESTPAGYPLTDARTRTAAALCCAPYRGASSVEVERVVHFEESMEKVVRAFEIAGVAVLAVGSVVAAARAAMSLRSAGRRGVYEQVRRDVGRSILLGL